MNTNDNIFQPADYGVLSKMMSDTNKAVTITIGIFVFIFTLTFILVNSTSNNKMLQKMNLFNDWKKMASDATHNMNNSKIFAGIMIILMNITSKYVPIKLGKTMERLMKHYISAPLLVFTVSWIGTRDLYIAFIITGLYILFAEILFNEDSSFCVLSEEFRDYHDQIEKEQLEKNEQLTEEDVIKARAVLEKAKKQKMDIMEYEGYTLK
uniref:Uncharacterized protein n=1 Tax=viral metagenome TaxID=1070528 RepID=A0A6C0ATU2_9ZZZZ|tara:strand:- start:1719 stop:2345 length:627 start_codon:yes stop_codon:yes gene_type:complete